MTNIINDAANWYANTFKASNWAVKLLGDKPTAEQLTVAHAFGKPGKQSLALAMAMREHGVTAGQILIACGNPQNNHRTAEITAGHFKRVPMPPSPQGHTVYKIELTKKGQARVDRLAKAAQVAAEAAAAEPATPVAAKASKRTSKAAKPSKRHAKVNKPVDGGISDSAGHNSPAFEVEPPVDVPSTEQPTA